MEKCANLGGARGRSDSAVAACSGCAGDYEDPDRTAWSDEQLDEPIDDDDQGDALLVNATTTNQPHSNAGKAIDQVAGRSNEDESENHHQA